MIRKIASTSRKIFSKAAGFTLIELIVVILILGVLSAAAIPNFFSSMRRSNFQSMVNEVSTLFEKARTQALASELDADWKTPPGGYGIFIDIPAQTASLFIDDFHAGCANPNPTCEVNMNYADEDIANRITPDGIFTAGGDTVIEEVNISSASYMKIVEASGIKVDSTVWEAEDDSKLTIIFTPPYAEALITTYDETIQISLKEIEIKFDLVTENTYRKIKFNRITTTPQITKGNNAYL
jgi:prepilin-type N-terminal cleavage/methylation domain-containing protein